MRPSRRKPSNAPDGAAGYPRLHTPDWYRARIEDLEAGHTDGLTAEGVKMILAAHRKALQTWE